MFYIWNYYSSSLNFNDPTIDNIKGGLKELGYEDEDIEELNPNTYNDKELNVDNLAMLVRLFQKQDEKGSISNALSRGYGNDLRIYMLSMILNHEKCGKEYMYDDIT